ncbi:DUF2189 domain-containing protein [Pseudorhodoferax sp. LjRoot39]|uniref:DUF2189 domain-containing protein n=1 Tax=Pseudorhodoferax sp. LjRoot39 TaxID=3342328 RepID=UPI003ECE3AF2
MPHHKANSALTESRRHAVRTVGAGAPLRWLARGWADLWRCPLPGLLHGLVLAGFGAALALVAHAEFWLLAGAFSGFLLVAPVAATGLYAVSRALERGERPTLATALRVWWPRDGRLVLFGVLLACAGTGWVVTSAALVTGFAPGMVRRPEDFLLLVVAAGQGWLFEAWLALGALLAAPVFASSVIAIPLLLDRRIGVLAAVLTSWRAVLENPLPMALWAVLLVGLTLLSLLPALLGLVLVAPWLAHASWHAYRELVA